MGFARHEVVLGQTTMRYWRCDRGHSETVLLLHGLGGDHRGLSELAEILDGVNLVLPDLPGYGESDPLPGRHTLAGYATAIEDFRVHIGLTRVHLVGHSLGASIALLYAAANPTALDSLCLLNPVSTANNVTANLGKIYYRIGAVLPRPLGRLWLASKPAVYLADRAVIKTRDGAVRRRILDEDYQNYRRASVRAMVESFLSYYDTAFDAEAATVITPSLLIAGDADAIAPADTVAALAARIPAGRSTALAGGGHLMPMERPADTAAIVNEFLATIRGSHGISPGNVRTTEGH